MNAQEPQDDPHTPRLLLEIWYKRTYSRQENIAKKTREELKDDENFICCPSGGFSKVNFLNVPSCLTMTSECPAQQ
jgi:hypothetical protein